VTSSFLFLLFATLVLRVNKMKFAVLFAAAVVVASARFMPFVRPPIHRAITGSNPGAEPPLQDFATDVVTGTPASGEFKVVTHKVLKESLISQTITGHALKIQGAASDFHIYTHDQKCPGRAATSKTAEKNKCKIATNAGFFNMDTGACVGHIISDSKTIHSTASGRKVMFGITHDGKYIAGYGNDTYIKKNSFKQLVQGRGWLVRNGKSYVSTAQEKESIAQSFVQLLAPRLAIGWDKDGHLLLVVVDGVEAKKKGLDLKTFASLLIELGAVEAVNLDGGGSVTLYWDGHICESSGVGQEACHGNPTFDDDTTTVDAPYERPVTSITCFK